MAGPLLEDVQALLCFARVVEHGSFTRAASELGISKSVVSGKTSALEARLGEQLLLRTTRKVSATAAGVRTYALARQMLEAAGAATAGAGQAAGGALRVSAPVTLAQEQLARPLAAFLRQHPGTRVELLLNDRIVDLVEERVDLAIRVTKLKDSGLIARRLAWTSLHVCAAPAYLAERGRPERPEQLLRHECLRYSLLTAEQEWRLYDAKGRVELSVRGAFETSSGAMLREACIAGLGLAMLPRFMVAAALERGALTTVLDGFAPRPLGVYAVRSGQRRAPELVRRLVEQLAADFRHAAWRA